ncbi:winged helix-turn-helix domain-containing protein [Virgisporangium aurantiacum]|uniref:winged helix-turn-helix domain-containing protein n=1 Tax=Virgisporangium aurantiacum TaxID=175570 RepID=UPI001EF1EEE8|nr:transcriptional regulator [Virgisporangium aurantiacum]
MTHHPPLPDPIINTTTRLSLMAVLAGAQEVEFADVRDTSGLSDSVVSKQATALQAAGYVTIRKGHLGRRPRTWLSLTPAGRAALHRHIAALRQIVDLADRADARPRR